MHAILPILLPLGALALIFLVTSAWGALTKSPPPAPPPGDLHTPAH